jgi:hypothetical protein
MVWRQVLPLTAIISTVLSNRSGSCSRRKKMAGSAAILSQQVLKPHFWTDFFQVAENVYIDKNGYPLLIFIFKMTTNKDICVE